MIALIEALPRARSALASSPIFALRELTVEPTEAGLAISGAVGSFYHKQLAQEAVRAAVDVPIVNLVRVEYAATTVAESGIWDPRRRPR